MLSAEEFLLFLVDEGNGTLLPLTSRTEHLALAGAVLMDLQLADRIDTDLDNIILSDPTPLGDDVLDPTLADIADAEETHDALYWVERTAQRGHKIRERTIARLVARGILVDPDDDGSLALTPAVAHARRYPSTNGAPREDVKLRIMRVLFADDIPDPHDIVIISLVDACNVWRKVLSAAELMKARKRIAIVSRLDLIGQAVARLVQLIRPTARVARDGANDLPLARGLPLVGSTFSLARDQRAFFLEEYQRLGPVFRVKTLTRTFVTIAGQEANLFMSRSERSHMHTSDMWDPLCAEVGASRFVLNMNGKDHVRMRRELKNGVSRGLIEHQLPEAVDAVRHRFVALPRNTPLPGLHTMQRLVGETVCSLAVGVSTDEYIDDVLIVLRSTVGRGLFRIPALPATPRFRRASRRVAELSDNLLMSHQLQQRGRKADVLDEVLELHRADPMFLPETDVALTSLLPLFAGLDTAAATIACMLCVVLKNPELRERVRAEADALFADATPAVEKARHMDVTNRVMLETMRMYTPGPGQMRKVTTSFDFAGHRIPAGVDLFIAGIVTHDLPEHFPDPQRFDIDRYLPGREEHNQPCVYTPFGLGAHRCAGRGLAEMMIPLIVATLLHEAEIELDPPTYELRMARWALFPSGRPETRLRFRIQSLRH